MMMLVMLVMMMMVMMMVVVDTATAFGMILAVFSFVKAVIKIIGIWICKYLF